MKKQRIRFLDTLLVIIRKCVLLEMFIVSHLPDLDYLLLHFVELGIHSELHSEPERPSCWFVPLPRKACQMFQT